MTTQAISWEGCGAELRNIRSARGQDNLPGLLRSATALLDRLRRLAAGSAARPIQKSYVRDGRADVIREVLEVRSALQRPPGADDEWEVTVAPFRERTLSEPLVTEFTQALARYTSAAHAATAKVEDLRKEVAMAERQQRLTEAYLEMLREMARCCSPQGVTS